MHLIAVTILCIMVLGYLGWLHDLRMTVRRQERWLGSLDREFDVMTNLLLGMRQRSDGGSPPTSEEMAAAEAALIELLDQLIRTQHGFATRSDMSP